MGVGNQQRGWWPVFPVELFWCHIRHEARRLFVPLSGALTLVLSMLVLMGTYFAVRPFGSAELGAKLLPALTFSVALNLFIVLDLSVPFALRAATAEDDLPLLMMTGQSPLGVWRAQVGSSALLAMLVPFLHLPLMVYVGMMGGVRLTHVGAMLFFWLIVWFIATGWASLGGALWAGSARDRMQGLSLVFMLVFGYGVLWLIALRILWLMNPSWGRWLLGSFQPPWSWSVPELTRLGLHAFFGWLASYASVIVLRGRWRSAAETGSHDYLQHEPQPVPQPVRAKVTAVPSLPTFPNSPGPQRPRCGDDPWFWKDFHVSGGSWFYWQLRIVTGAVLAVVVLVSFLYGLKYRAVEPVIFLTLLGWFIWLMFDVGQILTVEFQDRMWSCVRITPDSVESILFRKLRAFAAKFAPSLLPLGMICGLGLMSDAYQMILFGVPFLIIVCIPFAMTILYGVALPQNLIGGGWPMLRTLGVSLVMLAIYIPVMIFIDHLYPRGQRWWLQAGVSGLLSLSVTAWFLYATVCELKDPRRERLSADGG